MKLVTSYENPAIPWRKFDWVAFDGDQMSGVCADPDCGCRNSLVRGWGSTEEDAIIAFVRDLVFRNDAVQEVLYNCEAGAGAEYRARLHYHTCQQCDKVLSDECDCEQGNKRNEWCSARCKAAFDL